MEELFHLARSTNNQQRTLALQTLSNIVHKVRCGELEALVQSPVLPALIDAGVMFLLRWALDDSVDMVVSSAVSALCSLLVSDADEVCFSLYMIFFLLYVLISFLFVLCILTFISICRKVLKIFSLNNEIHNKTKTSDVNIKY